MRLTPRSSLSLATLALVAGTLTACGGSSDPEAAPDDASTDDFCAVYKDISTDGDQNDLDAAKKAADRLAEVGTPEDMPDDARKAFEDMISLVQGADSEKDLEEAFADGSTDAGSGLGALGNYLFTTCADELGLPSDLPTTIPSDLPSDLASGLPSDMPTDPEAMQSYLDEQEKELDDMLASMSADAS
ncbi:hypothetical protein [Nocardioides acrostichi]|uniref:Lipoprotein n=1 Tax=Nocardioides acrostichi TaxID=2784339 RepID=A0A930UZE0_9ACTN|nr:hypothetical protein [Nocardioides acrostichi]MBF4163713.1 hypothetical protein [Nocardioides acrostichi]